jgi:two-component system, OmpR family, sensor histidine kinase MtrB
VFGVGRFRLDLRARVVLFTSSALIASLLLLGAALHLLLAPSLYDQRKEEALQVTQRARVTVETALRAQSPDGTASSESVRRVVTDLAYRQAESSLYIVLVAHGEQFTSNPALNTGVLPPDLIDEVANGSRLAYVYIEAPVGESARMLVVGSPIQGPDERLQGYFFFPLTFQEKTLALLSRILVTIGLALLAVTIVLSAISTGRVLEPVRRARDVAERITSGELSARIPEANNPDDFGRLAESFNRMAGFLSQKIGELEHLSNLQARFVSDVSHELRTPLATVRMAADYIHSARSGLPADAQRAAVLLERELERFENLLEDLLEISRFDAGVVGLEPVEVDVSALLDEVVDELDVLAHNRDVTLTLNMDRGEGPPLVAADPRRLDRVFGNLVKNAIEHTAGGEVRISVGRSGGSVVVKVEDEGEGIPAEDLPHIFERFYRADIHRARTQGGTGLGLAIALENVHLHQGSIDVVSQVDHGSSFTVRLPAMERREQQRAPEGDQAPESASAPAPIQVPTHG